MGPNNAGKTAILDALRIALGGRGGAVFNEYDIHLHNENDNPKDSEGVSIEIISKEKMPGEWSEEIIGTLGDTIQQIPGGERGSFLYSVNLRVQYNWNENSESFEPSWDFLDINNESLSGGNLRSNLENYRSFLPIFYLEALRDVRNEFSSRSSKFWKRLLKDMNIPPDLESEAMKIFGALNNKLLAADDRFGDIVNTLDNTIKVTTRDTDGSLDLRIAPMNTWDLISRTEILLQNESEVPWLPLRRQGQGIQSLSVIFLFQAFVNHLLRELYHEESVPVLALEEPETHLHPHAIRTLFHHVNSLRGLKVIATHSAYFIQHVPLRDIRLIRFIDGETKIHSLPPNYTVEIPEFGEFDSIVENSDGLLSNTPGTLTVHGNLDDQTYRKLQKNIGIDQDRTDLETKLGELKEKSSKHIKDEELYKLETMAQRTRGEIFFANRWLLVEGQSDYIIAHAISYALNYDFDRYGVTVIDCKNNGNPATFAALARALEIPWLAVFDNDEAGKKYIQAIENRGIPNEEVNNRCCLHNSGDLEQQLVHDGLGLELRNILNNLGITNATNFDDEGLLDCLAKKKMDYARELATHIKDNPQIAREKITAFKTAIEKLQDLS